MWFVGAPVSVPDADVAEILERTTAMVPTRAGDRHLTLVYLGNVPEESVMRLWSALPSLALPEHAHAKSWEVFGRRAVALTLADDDARLSSAAHACIDVAVRELPELRVPPTYRPHVTIGRVRKGSVPPKPTALRAWPVPSEPLHVGPPTLFRTRNVRDADRYEVVHQQPA